MISIILNYDRLEALRALERGFKIVSVLVREETQSQEQAELEIRNMIRPGSFVVTDTWGATPD